MFMLFLIFLLNEDPALNHARTFFSISNLDRSTCEMVLLKIMVKCIAIKCLNPLTF